jgi:phosphate transport system permease protein
MRSRARGTALTDRLLAGVTGLLSATPVAAFLGLVAFLGVNSWPVIRVMGWSFFTDEVWNQGNLYAAHPVLVHGVRVMPGASFGAEVFLLGTAVTAGLAIILATPVAVLAAAAAAFSLPRRLARPVAALVETLAGVPSVVYGLFGLAVVGPFIVNNLGPFLDRVLPPLPFVTGPVETPTNLLTAALTLTLMILPIIVAMSRAAMEQVPLEQIEGARALGMTEWEVFRWVVLPVSGSAIVGAIILGLSRALGETMAVLMVSGDALNVLPSNWYAAVSTMAATIASQLDSAFQDPTGMAVKALGLLGLVLMLVTLGTTVTARALVRRAGRSLAPRRAVTPS